MRPALLAPLLLLAAPLGAQAPEMPTTPPGAPDASRVVAGTYHADPDHTQVLFSVNHMGFSLFDGAFGGATGTLVLDPKNPAAARVDIEIPISGLATTSTALNTHLKSADFFDAEKFPTARFVSTKVVPNGTRATISGTLTVKGISKPVVLDAHFIGAGTNFVTRQAALGFRATTRVKRSDFGVSYGVPLVSDAVDLTINVAFDRQK